MPAAAAAAGMGRYTILDSSNVQDARTHTADACIIRPTSTACGYT
jgi:hypothetical protein